MRVSPGGLGRRRMHGACDLLSVLDLVARLCTTA